MHPQISVLSRFGVDAIASAPIAEENPARVSRSPLPLLPISWHRLNAELPQVLIVHKHTFTREQKSCLRIPDIRRSDHENPSAAEHLHGAFAVGHVMKVVVAHDIARRFRRSTVNLRKIKPGVVGS